MTHPHYLGWQIDWPVFIKMPFVADGKEWKKGEHFNWLNRDLKPNSVAQLYNSGYLYHNKELEKETKVGDRLGEMSMGQLDTLVTLLNAEVKSRTNSTAEYTSKKIKQSKIEEKQRAFVRNFLRHNRWIEDKFYEVRDNILDAKMADTPQE
jgi:hypothetical protein